MNDHDLLEQGNKIRQMELDERKQRLQYDHELAMAKVKSRHWETPEVLGLAILTFAIGGGLGSLIRGLM